MTCYTFEDLGVDGFYIIDVCVCVCQHKFKKKYSASRGQQYVPALKKGGL